MKSVGDLGSLAILAGRSYDACQNKGKIMVRLTGNNSHIKRHSLPFQSYAQHGISAKIANEPRSPTLF
jgi:hypothetical protein